MTEKIKIFTEDETLQGFHFQTGFAALIDECGEITAATSGWEGSNGWLYVYRPSETGEWIADWEDQWNFPVAEVLDCIQDFREKKDLEKAVAFARSCNEELYISDEPIRFVDVVPGRKSSNGGEYGFYTIYTPVEGHPGIYRVESHCTCDFDRCGTGYEGYEALTTREYRRLKKASDKVESEGSKY